MGTVYRLHMLRVLINNGEGKSVALAEAFFDLGKCYAFSGAVHEVLDRDWKPPPPPEGSREGMHGTILVPTGRTNASGSPLYSVKRPERRRQGLTRELREILEYSQESGVLYDCEDAAVCEVLTLAQLCEAFAGADVETWHVLRAARAWADTLSKLLRDEPDERHLWLAVLVGD